MSEDLPIVGRIELIFFVITLGLPLKISPSHRFGDTSIQPKPINLIIFFLQRCRTSDAIEIFYI
jgi:hypothetical protein